MNLDLLIRENIKKLPPVSLLRNEEESIRIFLDSNENRLGSPLAKWYNRYPDPLQRKLKQKISGVKNIDPSNFLLGNGSRECIDLLIRIFCEPKVNNIITCSPAGNLCKHTAHVNDVEIKDISLLPSFQLDLESLKNAIDQHTRIIFIGCPNELTGSILLREDIEMILNNFEGIVVVDETYINFSRQRSMLVELMDYENLVIIQSFSKAWGLAGLGLSVCFGSTGLIEWLNKVKPDYNINEATTELVLKALDNLENVNEMIVKIVSERQKLSRLLNELEMVEKVFPSEGNFLMVRFKNAGAVDEYLMGKGILVKNISKEHLCENCLRITIGTPEENTMVVNELMKLETI